MPLAAVAASIDQIAASGHTPGTLRSPSGAREARPTLAQPGPCLTKSPTRTHEAQAKGIDISSRRSRLVVWVMVVDDCGSKAANAGSPWTCSPHRRLERGHQGVPSSISSAPR